MSTTAARAGRQPQPSGHREEESLRISYANSRDNLVRALERMRALLGTL